MPGSLGTRCRRNGTLTLCLMCQRQKFCDLIEAHDETVRKIMFTTEKIKEKLRFVLR